ncbi:microsomal triglyceride transfer protein-like [Branchiostoma floridae x Branchiostoma japonicum]
MWSGVFLLLCSFVLGEAGLPGYQTGHAYHYNYQTRLRLNEPDTDKPDVGFQLSAGVDVTVVWGSGDDQLVRVQLKDAQLSHIGERKAAVFQKVSTTNLQAHPVMFHWRAGQVEAVYAAEKDTTDAVNLKKGVVSLFQVQTAAGERQETDVSGQCMALYDVSKSKVMKTRDCLLTTGFTNNNKVVGVDVKSASSVVYELSGDQPIIQSAIAEENHVTRVNLREELGTIIFSGQELKLEKQGTGGAAVQGASVEEAVTAAAGGEKFLKVSLATEEIIQECTEDCESPAEIVTRYRDDLSTEALAHLSSSNAFLEVLKRLRHAGKETILNILTDEANGDIVPQLIDIATAAQTDSAMEALLEFLDFSVEEDTDLPDRFLFILGFATHPTDKTLSMLLEKLSGEIGSEKIYEAMALTLGALVYTYCLDPQQCEQPIVGEVKTAFLEGLESAEFEDGQLMFLRALGNARLPDTITVLLTHAEGAQSNAVSMAALKALGRFDSTLLDSNGVRRSLSRIFHQNKKTYENTVRTAAASLLLMVNPSPWDVRNILLSLSTQEPKEVSTFIWARIKDLLDTNHPSSVVIQEVLKDVTAANYYTLAQNGLSAAYSNIMADTLNAVATYGLFIEFAKSALMRRSNMDVFLHGQDNSIQILQVALEAEGLEAMMGEEAEDEEASASGGMGLILMDVQVRPFKLFAGQAELMAAAWSYSGVRMSAVTGIVLMQDHFQIHHLQSGVVVESTFQGGVSVELGGSVDISLWNRASVTLVSNNGALVVKGSATVDSPLVKVGVDLNAEAEATIDFTTSVDFSDMPFTMCLQMEQKAFQYKRNISLYEKVPGKDAKFRLKRERTRSIPEKSFPLFTGQNNAQCRAMFSED